MSKAFRENWRRLAAVAGYDANELAKLSKVSVRQMQRYFRSMLGRTPQDCLNEERLLAAQHLLLAGSPVKKVALDLGYKQSSHFCRQFKLFTSLTPSKFIDSEMRSPCRLEIMNDAGR